MRRRIKRLEPIDELKQRYGYLKEMIIKTSGHILLLRKFKGESKEPLDIDLLDFKNEIDDDIGRIIRKIDWKLRLYEKPDGVKE